MKTLILFFSLLGSLSLSAQTIEWNKPGQNRKSPPPASAAHQAAMTQVQIGMVSVYADYLAGKPTAYGEVYRPEALTASHALLPIGSIIKVTRTDNGQSISVRVNDSNGLCNGCIVMLSRGAAAELNLPTNGQSRVTVERTGFSNWNPKPQQMTYRAVPRSVPAQPSVYEANTAPRQTNTTYPSSSPVVYGSRTVGVQPHTATIQPNRVGESAPDFGYAYKTVDVVPSVEEDPNAYRPAQYSNRTIPATVTPAPRTAASTPYPQPAVIQREVTDNNTAYRSVPTYTKAPATYSRPTAVPAAPAPVVEKQVTNNAVNQGYAIQLAAYGNIEYATRQVRNLQANGLDNVFVASVQKTDGSTLNRVFVGPFANMSVAQSSAKQLQQNKQLKGIVIRLQ
ncbi:MAG: SPOR domain-containing protein [Bacteroidota bacterium]